jgi:hypothetical protein
LRPGCRAGSPSGPPTGGARPRAAYGPPAACGNPSQAAPGGEALPGLPAEPRPRSTLSPPVPTGRRVLPRSPCGSLPSAPEGDAPRPPGGSCRDPPPGRPAAVSLRSHSRAGRRGGSPPRTPLRSRAGPARRGIPGPCALPGHAGFWGFTGLLPAFRTHGRLTSLRLPREPHGARRVR